MTPLDILILSLATWRISHMLVTETGPLEVFTKLRALKMGGLFDCIYCTSIWIGFLVMLLWLWDMDMVLYPFVFSGLAMLLRAYTGAGLNDY